MNLQLLINDYIQLHINSASQGRMSRPLALATNSLAYIFRVNLMTHTMSESMFCDACGEAHGGWPCPLTQIKHIEAFGSHNSAGFALSKLPVEIRLDIYDELCAEAILADQRSAFHPRFDLQYDGAGVVVKKDRILLESNRLDAIVRWIKGPFNKVFRGLLLANRDFHYEVSDYVRKANAARLKNNCVQVIWFEDLGHLLTRLGPQGRSNLMNLEFTWDNMMRPSHHSAKELGPPLWRSDAGPAKIFTMLAACKNLANVTAKIDTYRLLNMKGDRSQQFNRPESAFAQLQGLRGMQELRNVKVNGALKIQLSARSSIEVGPWPEEFGEWLMAGMHTNKEDVDRCAIEFALNEDRRVAKIKAAAERQAAAELAAAESASARVMEVEMARVARMEMAMRAGRARRSAASLGGDDPDDGDYMED
jgi:hypothetical protein